MAGDAFFGTIAARSMPHLEQSQRDHGLNFVVAKQSLFFVFFKNFFASTAIAPIGLFCSRRDFYSVFLGAYV
jgi:hypothetical protein